MQSDSSLPTLDGKYELLRKLGEGGMGAVYEGRHRGTGRRVAVKVIAGDAVKKSAEIVSRFQREAMASGAIESQYIAQVLDTGVDAASGSPYLVMELLTGQDLEKAIETLGPLPPDLALRIAAQACLGLQKAHDARVIHRDIKPANLFLARREGGEIVVKILDFGIAKAKLDEQLSASGDHAMTRTGTMLGSPLYMSPEQAMGRKSIDHRADIWSLGVVLYEALCGKTPHAHAETIGELLIRICGEPPQLLQERAPWVPPEVTAIVHKALALDPQARFASASEMYAALRARLPGGHALEESMFVPLTPQARAFTAPRWSLTSDVRAPLTSQSNPDLALLAQARITAATLAQKGTMAEFAQSSAAAPSGRSRRVSIAVAVAAAIGIGATAFFAFHRPNAQSPAPESTRASAGIDPPAPSAAPSPPTPSAPPAAAPTQVDPSASAAASAAPAAQAAPPAPASKPGQPRPSRAAAPSAPPAPSVRAPPPAAAPSATGSAKYNPLDHL